MRIAVVSHDTFWPLRGGGGIRVYWVVRNLLDRGHRVSVVAPFLHQNGMDVHFPGIHVLSLGKITRFVAMKELVYAFMMKVAFFRLLFLKCDVIYAHNVVAALPAVLVGNLRRIPVIFDMDDLLTGYSKHPWVYKMGPRLEAWVARRAILTLATSHHVEAWCHERGIERTMIIRHGVALDLFSIPPRERKYITFTGGIEVNDGVLLIPDAAKLVLNEFPDIQFLFAGEGKDLQRLKDAVHTAGLEKAFVFRGWVNHEEIPEILAESQVGLITSLEVSATVFSSPLRSYEYMAAGLPFVASDLSGIVEQVELSQAGITFKNGDSESLAESILTLLKDKTLREKLGKNGRKYVEAHCDWNKNVTEISEICEKMVSDIATPST